MLMVHLIYNSVFGHWPIVSRAQPTSQLPSSLWNTHKIHHKGKLTCINFSTTLFTMLLYRAHIEKTEKQLKCWQTGFALHIFFLLFFIRQVSLAHVDHIYGALRQAQERKISAGHGKKKGFLFCIKWKFNKTEFIVSMFEAAEHTRESRARAREDETSHSQSNFILSSSSFIH